MAPASAGGAIRAGRKGETRAYPRERGGIYDCRHRVGLARGIGLLYEDLHRSKEIGPDDPLPPVLPIVLYNGAEPWTAKTDLADLI
ncbi:hypothetical protein, partial [uncultured Thiodictyon sp.]|uniref:hypothetical protein n=1 Tax=uncultured Thiodictyon sp. TaxID=1846217 RepID=UPI0025D0AFF5